MASFDFTTLNFSDLENLFCELLNAEQPPNSLIRYKIFKDGKDKGIDVLYSSNSHSYDHVGQVKHYLYSDYDGLYKKLKSEEVAKVKNLNPNKYLFATSLDLSVHQSELIKELFHPFVKNLNDIFGRKDFNLLLDKHPDVLANCFKLWLSSTEVLKTIIHSDLVFRTSDYEKELRKKIRNYVKTPAFDRALLSLEKNKFIVITGEPGVGKTTLADMLTFVYIQRGYSFTYIQDDIKEAERVLQGDTTKQVIYYDDFLGSNEAEINKAKASETTLRKIIRRIESNENKLLILTTRSYLLISAIQGSENLSRSGIRDQETIVSLEDYSSDLRNQLYEIHIDESEIREDLKVLLRSDPIQNFVVNHPNFFPRSIEFITTKKIVDKFNVNEFEAFIYKNFDFPDEIYSHAYNDQIEDDDRLLINTLMTFDVLPSPEDLEDAFLARIKIEKSDGQQRKKFNAFRRSLTRLDGAFISVNKGADQVEFITPSLVDFLNNHIKQDKDELQRMSEAACFTSQLSKMFLQGDENTPMPQLLKDKLINNYPSFISVTKQDMNLLIVALVLFKNTELKESENVICEILEEIDDWDFLHHSYSINKHFRLFMTASKSYSKVHKILDSKIFDIITGLVGGEDDLEDIADLIDKLQMDYNFRFNHVDTTKIDEHIESLFLDYIDQEIDNLTDHISDETEADEKREEISDLIERFKNQGLNIDTSLDEFDLDWHEIVMHNQFKRAMEKDD